MKKLAVSAALLASLTLAALTLSTATSAHSDDDEGSMMGRSYGHMPVHGYDRMPMHGYDQQMPIYGPGAMMGPAHGFGMPMLDRNSDGVVGEDEAASHFETAFGTLDSNDDGALSEDEFVYPQIVRHFGPEHPRWQRRHQRRHERFEALDADDDDVVTKAEFMNAGRERCATADADGDGTVTVWEFRSSRRRF